MPPRGTAPLAVASRGDARARGGARDGADGIQIKRMMNSLLGDLALYQNDQGGARSAATISNARPTGETGLNLINVKLDILDGGSLHSARDGPQAIDPRAFLIWHTGLRGPTPRSGADFLEVHFLDELELEQQPIASRSGDRRCAGSRAAQLLSRSMRRSHPLLDIANHKHRLVRINLVGRT